MTLIPGTRLGPYEIVSPLGAGGMGEVYRARDTRLGRDVAVKVLPQHLSQNPEVRARFEREARTISSLNHPHICTLFDVGREGDTDYLVMELVDGETLAERLARGHLPTTEVLRLGAQIADALDRAHRAGVIHRDLKPGNVMLTKSGAKLMDFGLARATGLAPGGGSGVTMAALTTSPTMAQALTAEGTIVGTFQYMSPEQLEGKEADARADLWALGCVLHEMATGKRAFDGTSQASLIAAIMHVQPLPVSQISPMMPPALDRLVGACLTKDPADRVQSAHDVKLQLAWMAEGATSMSGVATPGIPAVQRQGHWILPVLAAAAAVLATILVMLLLPGRDSAPPEPMQRYTVGMADLQGQSTPMISPDGKSIIYSARDGGSRGIFRRRLASFEVAPIEGTEDGTAPFFSPDGAWLGFITSTGIRKVPIDGGVAQTILNEPRIAAADWGQDGTIYYTPRSGGTDGLTALSRVPATGGKPEVVAAIDTTNGEIEAWGPDILPDGKTVLITLSRRTNPSWQIVAVRADGSRHLVIDNALICTYVQSGHLLYFDSESQAVLAAPFDPVKAVVTGPAVPLTERVDNNYCFDVSNDGKLLYVPLPGAGEGEEIVWLDRKGATTPAMETRGPWMQPRVSPDGKRVLLRKVGDSCELWMLDVERSVLSRAVQAGDNHDAIWSPDGSRIACQQVDAPPKMVSLTVEGAREMKTIFHGIDPGAPQSWSGGGNRLVFTRNGRGTRSDIWSKSMDGSSPPVVFLATEFNESDPAISPDGGWIAYTSNEAGSADVFMRRFPDTGTTWQVSTGGGGSPLWSRDGRELFFVSGTAMMVVAIETGPTLQVGNPVRLFDGGFSVTRARDFDVAPDGRFVALRSSGAGVGQRELRMLLNWEQAMTASPSSRH
ncbi:MAG: protein kinase [Candidatus Eisenbacteria bacterium]|nr:protein kinase [Candidatus Eisenbacteria bacterium]